MTRVIHTEGLSQNTQLRFHTYTSIGQRTHATSIHGIEMLFLNDQKVHITTWSNEEVIVARAEASTVRHACNEALRFLSRALVFISIRDGEAWPALSGLQYRPRKRCLAGRNATLCGCGNYGHCDIASCMYSTGCMLAKDSVEWLKQHSGAITAGRGVPCGSTHVMWPGRFCCDGF